MMTMIIQIMITMMINIETLSLNRYYSLVGTGETLLISRKITSCNQLFSLVSELPDILLVVFEDIHH